MIDADIVADQFTLAGVRSVSIDVVRQTSCWTDNNMARPAGTRLLTIDCPVWFVLVELRVTGNTKQPWVAGSTAIVQAFVPGKHLETCLSALDAFLVGEELERIDTLKALRYESGAEVVLDQEYMWEPLEEAGSTKECVLGMFVVSRDTATPREGFEI